MRMVNVHLIVTYHFIRNIALYVRDKSLIVSFRTRRHPMIYGTNKLRI